LFKSYDNNDIGYEISATCDEFVVTIIDKIPIKSRVHVPFNNKSFATKTYCKDFYMKFDNYRFFTIGCSYQEAIDNDDYYGKFFLIKDKYFDDIIRTNKEEIDICPCIIEFTKSGHGGTIIIGTNEQLLNIINMRRLNNILNIEDKSFSKIENENQDMCETLLSVSISSLIDKESIYDPHNSEEISINHVLKQIIKKISKSEKYIDEYILVGVNIIPGKETFIDVSHGKRKLYETPKECAIRELKEEFLLNVNNLKSYISTCSTEFFIHDLNEENINEDVVNYDLVEGLSKITINS